MNPIDKSTAQIKNIKNIILVHGAFVDGSSWESVFYELIKKGYEVTIVQNPLTSLEDDVKTLNYAIEKQDGPTLLVGQSWGGFIITHGGTSPKVAGLVYVAAFVPEIGETTLDIAQKLPSTPENGILPPDANGIIYYDKEKFHKGFAADVPKEKADFLFAAQGTFVAQGFLTPATETAWKDKPAFAILATEDRAIIPEIQRFMYERAKAVIKEVKGSHAVFISQPKEVADFIDHVAESLSN